ncbi:hypothetical protein SS05631_a48040 (plasmid) [Sinorhizobium sp. CCBAU 05631]|nr:hypothetical protein SS05631_a48040 [Sinorhizobium sp. CCBAU 05631]
MTGLETGGARNYITKPFASPEYLARVRAALRGPPEASLQQDFPFVWRMGAACIEERIVNSSSLRVHSSDGLSQNQCPLA